MGYNKTSYQRNKKNMNKAAAKWQKENPDKVKEIKKRYRQNNQNKIKAYRQRDDVKEKQKLRMRKKRLENPNLVKEFNDKRKEKIRTFMKKHRAKPEVKKKNAKYNKKHHDENREHYNKQAREWNKKNPEKRLAISKRHLEKLGIQFKLPSRQYGMALESWGKSVRKLLGDRCIICGSTDKLNSHHILYKALHPELSLNINNGVPLCKDHHLEIHSLNPIVRGI